jgi:hypothetical protein
MAQTGISTAAATRIRRNARFTASVMQEMQWW